MEVFLPIATQQTLTIIPRYNSGTVTLSVRDEETDLSQEFNILDTRYDNGYLSMDFSYDFKETGSYSLEVKDNAAKILWRGKAIATAQDPQDFKMNVDIIEL
jgi:hypothetical protein